MQLDKIKKEISEFEAILLKMKDENISRLEKDLILQKLRDMYEQVLAINVHTSQSIDEAVKEGNTEESSQQNDSEIIMEETIPEETTDIKTEREKDIIVKEEIKEKPQEVVLKDEESKPVSEHDEINEVEKKIQESTTPKQKVESTLDLFTTEEQVFADTSSTKEVKSIEDKIKMNKIVDLKKAIGINEKFQFINELFNGDLKKYTIAIDELNEAEEFENANKKFIDLKNSYQWSEETEAFEMLKNLIERKYKS